MKRALVFLIASTCLFPAVLPAQLRVESVPELCPGLRPDQRPVVAVMDFRVKVDVTGDVGGGMASMLSNALINTGCFNVVERARLDDVMNEQAFGMSGAVEESTAAGVGRIQGARYQIMGELTEFSDNESGVSGAARRLTRVFGGRRAGDVAGSFGLRRAHIGFIIKVVDTTSALVIGSQSFDKKRNSVGLAASGWAGRGAFAGASQISKAMADAIEEGIIGAVRYIVPYRDQMTDAMPAVRRAGVDANAGADATMPESCALLQTATRPPRVVVIIPEEHLLGHWGAYGDGRAFQFDEYEGDRRLAPSAGVDTSAALAGVQRAIRPPDPAGETEIVKRFIERGFRLVDDQQMQILRADERFRLAHHDPGVAAALGRDFEADIVITGEAFSEFSKQINGMMSCRARVEAKAIEVATGRIIAADGLHASAIDVSEVIAGKTALRKAGGKVADYFYTQICADRSAVYAGTSGAAQVAGMGRGGGTELIISGVDFMSSKRLEKAIAAVELVSAVQQVSYRDQTVRFRVAHQGSADELAEALLGGATDFPVEIVALEGGKIVGRFQ